MSIFDKVGDFHLHKKGDFLPSVKSPVLSGLRKDKAIMYPLIYFRKSKAISQEHFDELMDCIEITLKKKQL